jgi:hypothetical protein
MNRRCVGGASETPPRRRRPRDQDMHNRGHGEDACTYSRPFTEKDVFPLKNKFSQCRNFAGEKCFFPCESVAHRCPDDLTPRRRRPRSRGGRWRSGSYVNAAARAAEGQRAWWACECVLTGRSLACRNPKCECETARQTCPCTGVVCTLIKTSKGAPRKGTPPKGPRGGLALIHLHQATPSSGCSHHSVEDPGVGGPSLEAAALGLEPPAPNTVSRRRPDAAYVAYIS